MMKKKKGREDLYFFFLLNFRLKNLKKEISSLTISWEAVSGLKPSVLFPYMLYIPPENI